MPTDPDENVWRYLDGDDPLIEAWTRYFNGHLFTKPTAIRASEPTRVHRKRILFEQGWHAALEVRSGQKVWHGGFNAIIEGADDAD